MLRSVVPPPPPPGAPPPRLKQNRSVTSPKSTASTASSLRDHVQQVDPTKATNESPNYISTATAKRFAEGGGDGGGGSSRCSSVDPPEQHYHPDESRRSSPESPPLSQYSRRLFDSEHRTEKKQDDNVDDDEVDFAFVANANDDDSTLGSETVKDLNFERHDYQQQRQQQYPINNGNNDTDNKYLIMIHQLRQQLALVEQQAAALEHFRKSETDDLHLIVDSQREKLRQLLIMQKERDEQERAWTPMQPAAAVNNQRNVEENAQLREQLQQAQAAIANMKQTHQQETEEAREKVRSLQADKRAIQAQLQEFIVLKHESNMRGNRDAPPASYDLESLRRKLGAVRHELDRSEESVREKEALIENLIDQVDDRDTRIGHLMRSSVGLEQQLQAVQMELTALRSKASGADEEGEGYDVILMEGGSKEEVEQLHTDLDSRREVEKSLTHENARLSKQSDEMLEANARLKAQVDVLESELGMLRTQLREAGQECLAIRNPTENETLSNSGTDVSVTPLVQIQERDKAISNLVQRSMEQEGVIAELNSQLKVVSEGFEALQAEKASPHESSHQGPSWDEVKQLRRETEMFAEQIIEQDEEIETLTRAIRSREEQARAMEQEGTELRRNLAMSTSTIADLSSKVDELEEANQLLLEEIRELKRKQTEFEEAGNETVALRQETVELKAKLEQVEAQLSVLSKEKADLEAELESERAKQLIIDSLDEKRMELEAQIKAKDVQLKQKETQLKLLQQSATNAMVDEMQVESLKSEVDSLRLNLAHQTDALDRARNTIFELEHEVAQKESSATTNLNEEKEEIMVEVELLLQQLEESQAEVKTLSEIVDNYELKLRLIAQDKDTTIDNLNRVLATQKEDKAEELEFMRREVEATLAAMKELREEVENEVTERDGRIFALQQALTAHQELVDQMKTEMDHLQGGMETRAVSRREEIDDMQQELVELTKTVAQQERQIKSLMGEIEDKKFEHAAEIDKLRKELEVYHQHANEAESRERNTLDTQVASRVNEVKDRTEKLRWKNKFLQNENADLRKKLAKEVLREITEKIKPAGETKSCELEGELESQAKRVTELESEIEELKKLLQRPESETEAPVEVAPSTTVPVPCSTSSVSSMEPPSSPSLSLSARRQKGLGFLSRQRR
ncbi:hypothetical protein MPSEU_000772700 [Mayamaea pseudoterrestris]|nr:hypothetical protein MPSEU_000772700 [Mayamaea pseudoterrestris]